MADVLFSSQAWQVRSEVPGVPEPILTYRYAQAVKEFLQLSEAWRVTLPATYDFVDGEDFPDVSADLPVGAYVIRPLSVRWVVGSSCSLPFIPRDQLERAETDWESLVDGTPRGWTITQPGKFRMFPLATTTVPDAIRLRVALGITVPAAVSLPEELMREWDNAFAAGALMNLLKMPGKDWTDLKLAGAYGEQFLDYVTQARARAAADYGQPVRTVRYGGI